LLSACKSKTDYDFYYAADFNPTESVCFIWTKDYYEIIPQLTGVISQKDKVRLIVSNNDNLSVIKSDIKNRGGNPENLQFTKLEKKPQTAWIRDYGPAYLTNREKGKKMVNFKYFDKQNIFNEMLGERMDIPVEQSDLSSTGGARETNGKGTIILCEAHELDENKPKTKQEIEKEISNALSLKKVIWLKKGIPQDDGKMSGPLHDQIFPGGVNGHIDEFCRFANDSTILISSVSESEAQKHPILAEAKKRLDENYEILTNSTDQEGRKFHIVKVPFAPLQINKSGRDGRMVTSVTSYMNFIISNSFVILPSYTGSANELTKDDYIAKEIEVEKIFKKVFPEREIIKLQSAALNRFGGGFHCISSNIPM